MCRFKSAIATQSGEIYHDPFIDSHEDIIELHHIHNGGLRPRYTPIEFKADGEDLFDPDKYRLVFDAERPDWADDDWVVRVTKKMGSIIRAMIITDERKVLSGGCYIFGPGAVIRRVIHGRIIAISAKANLHGAHLEGANLEGAYLYGADLRGANLQGADLEGANLSGADLERADLEGANLRGANLEGAYLYGADLRGANLQGADLEGANLRGADLRGAHLERAYLEGANLYGAHLERAYLEGANLYGADLRGANLQGAYIGNSNPPPGWEKSSDNRLMKQKASA
ncbi:MAG: pentapeptide repeat-containing protein [Planctomycetota bacterium]|nr:pentapeptide repeat-containing protein [Planctomycetota bacterium]